MRIAFGLAVAALIAGAFFVTIGLRGVGVVACDEMDCDSAYYQSPYPTLGGFLVFTGVCVLGVLWQIRKVGRD